MRGLVCFAVVAYQRWAPEAVRGQCIFSESCSHFVLRAARERGGRAALAALGLRMRRCRPGYFRLSPSVLFGEIAAPVRLADGSVVDLSELSPRVQTQLAGG
jgi:Putative membrane protein insertion efficiency factor